MKTQLWHQDGNLVYCPDPITGEHNPAIAVTCSPRNLNAETEIAGYLLDLIQPKPPTPVAWADLKDGETYWRVRNGNSRCAPLCVSITINLACRPDEHQQIKWENEYKDAQGRPMIYGDDEHGTGAEKAVAAMTFALRQWLEEVGK